MAYNVAQAEVTVVPNARNFGSELRTEVLAEADRIGREAGDEIVKGIRERVRVGLADLPDAEIDVDTTKASAEVDKFVAETKAKTATAGRESGQKMADEMAGGISGRGLLIGSAIAAGVIAGGPLIAVAGGTVMGVLAAVIQHNAPQVEAATGQVVNAFTDEFGKVTKTTVPALVLALQTVKASAHDLATEAAPAFAALDRPIQNVTQGVIGLVRNALPGLVSSVRDGEPIFLGFQHFLEDTGSAVSGLFTAITAHAPAAGTTLSALGSILNSLLPAIGTILGEGAELGATVLPALASVLGVLNSVLGAIAPILPEVALGFAAWKVAQGLDTLVGKLATGLLDMGVKAEGAALKLGLTAAEADVASGGFLAAAGAAEGLEAAMGPVGWVLAAVGFAVPFLVGQFGQQDKAQQEVAASAKELADAVRDANGAITEETQHKAAIDAQKAGLLDYAQTWGVTSQTIVQAILGQGNALDVVKAAAADYATGQKAAADATDAHTSAGMLQRQGFQQNAMASDQMLQSLLGLNGGISQGVTEGQQLAGALGQSSGAAQENAARLTGLSNGASAAAGQINLLKTALDQLTGKAVTYDQAQIAVTQAVESAKNAVKGHTAELAFNHGELDLGNAKSAQAAQLLIGLAGQQKNATATAEQQGKTMAEVNKIADDQRGQFIAVAREMGASASQAETLANRYLGIPKDVHTEITADTAQATMQAEAFKTYWESITSRHVTLYVDQKGNSTGASFGVGVLGTRAQAAGGVLHAYAGGGIEPMAAGVADIVAPQTYRLIGDRITDDEAYIPINDSARSLSILATTASRMGFELSRLGSPASGPTKVDSRQYAFHITAPSTDPAAIARSVRDAQADLEFLHG